VNGGLLNRVYFTIVKQVVFEVNLVFSPRTHKCRVGACIGTMLCNTHVETYVEGMYVSKNTSTVESR